MDNDTTTAKTTTIEIADGLALVHETTGAFHAQDNPGEQVAAYGVGDDPMTLAEIAAVTGFDADRLVDITTPGDAQATYFEVAE